MKKQYINKQNIIFNITSEEANVPSGADYYGYFFIVNLEDSEESKSGKIYKAFVKKELCKTKNKADIWLNTIAFQFLKEILETYENGKTLILLPKTEKWMVM